MSQVRGGDASDSLNGDEEIKSRGNYELKLVGPCLEQRQTINSWVSILIVRINNGTIYCAVNTGTQESKLVQGEVKFISILTMKCQRQVQMEISSWHLVCCSEV